MRGYLSGNNYSVLVTSAAPPWVSGQNTKGHFRAENTSYLGFCQKSATFGYQLVSSRYPAAKSHTGGHFTRLDSLDRNFILKKIYRASQVEWSKIQKRQSLDSLDHTVHYASCHATTLAIRPVWNVDKYYTVLPDLAKEDLRSVEFMTRWNRF